MIIDKDTTAEHWVGLDEPKHPLDDPEFFLKDKKKWRKFDERTKKSKKL